MLCSQPWDTVALMMNPMSPSLQDAALVSDLELKSPSPARLLSSSPNHLKKAFSYFLAPQITTQSVLHTHKSLHAASLCAGASPNSAPGRPLPEVFLYSITISLHCLPATQHNCFCQPSKPKSPRRVWGHRRPQVPKPSRGCLEFHWLLETSKGQAWRTGVTVPKMCHNGTGVIQTWHVCSQLEPMDTVSLGDPTGQLRTSLFLWDRGRVVSATRPSSWF